MARMMLKHLLIVLALWLAFASLQTSLADDLYDPRLIVSEHKEISQEFGDLHCVWFSSVEKGDSTQQYRLEFWSKDQSYYRLDRAELGEFGEPSYPISRMIVRPEGYALIEAKHEDDPGAVVGFGAAAEGLDRIAGNYFFDSATRLGGVFPVADQVGAYLSGDQRWKVNAVSSESGSINLELDWSDGKTRTQTSASLDPTTFSCTKATLTNYQGSEITLTIETQKEYDTNRIVPVEHREIWTRNDGSNENWTFTRDMISLESPAMEVFSLPTGLVKATSDARRVWGRRLAIFVVGIVLLASYFTIRRKNKPESS
jgi:hypothetical protein